MAFQQITITVDQPAVDSLVDFFNEHEALSVVLQDAADHAIFQEAPEETPLWPQTKIQALFSLETNLDPLLLTLKCDFPDIKIAIETISDQNWVATSRDHFQPQHYADRLWILPSWYDDKEYSGTLVKLDPGLAFGTGTHPTTALCLEWLAQHPPKNLSVIDYGCGSGILALAALALGASHVTAIDHDPQALTATKNNATLNSFVNKKNLELYLPEKTPTITADVVIANILANPIISLANILKNLLAPQGKLILSGFFNIDVPRIQKIFPEFKTESVETKEQWARLVLTR